MAVVVVVMAVVVAVAAVMAVVMVVVFVVFVTVVTVPLVPDRDVSLTRASTRVPSRRWESRRSSTSTRPRSR